MTTFLGYRAALTNMYNKCSRGIMGEPDLMIGSQVAWEQYHNSMALNERYVMTDQRILNVLGGSSVLAYRNAAFVWDEVVVDPLTNGTIVDNIGLTSNDLAEDTVYFINSDTMEWIYDAETNFITTPMVRPENQDAHTGQILCMAIMGVNNRRKNGVIVGVQHTAYTS